MPPLYDVKQPITFGGKRRAVGAQVEIPAKVVEAEGLAVRGKVSAVNPKDSTGGGKGSNTPPPPPPGGLVSINTATAEEIAATAELINLDEAKLIVAHREQHGNFVKLEELTNIKGIGDKTVQANVAKLTV